MSTDQTSTVVVTDEVFTFGLKSWSRGQKSQAASAICSGGVSAVIGSSDLDGLTLVSGGASGNQLSCSLPFEAERPIVEPAWQAQPQVCDDGAGSSLIDLQRSPVIRTDDTIAGFLRFAGLSASCAQTVGRSPVLRGSGGFFSCSPWIKPKSTTGSPSPKAWRPRAARKVGFTFALVPLPMASQTQCPTCRS